MRRSLFGLFFVVAGVACGGKHGSGVDADTDTGPPVDACDGLYCYQFDCGSKGLPPTTLSGTVYAPNGSLPLYGVNVYVPTTDPGALPDGVRCDRCDVPLPGNPIVSTITDEAGHFVLENVPATSDIPLVITSGKWRRQIKIPNVTACQDLPLDAVETTFPKSRTDLTANTTSVDLPQIAITTGNADALDCLIRRLGVDDKEITTDAQGGKVHLFNGNGANSFAPGFAGGTGAFPASTTLWGVNDKPAAVAKLSNYDIVLFSCEGGQDPGSKSQTAMDAVHDYADKGGRMFMSHWHNIWIGGEDQNLTHGLPDWQAVATFDYGAGQPAEGGTEVATIDETVPKGMSFATWMQNVGGSPVMRGQVPVVDPRYTLRMNDPAKGARRVWVDPATTIQTFGTSVQDLEFTTPQSVEPAARCGKVVFSDMHVSSGSKSQPGTPYPGQCATTPLTPQEKALAFIFFDISSCIGPVQ